jgi:hypothetical protein
MRETMAHGPLIMSVNNNTSKTTAIMSLIILSEVPIFLNMRLLFNILSNNA